MITLQGAIEKSPILLLQYWNFEWLDGTKIISYFGVSNNIIADCTYLSPFSCVPLNWTVYNITELLRNWRGLRTLCSRQFYHILHAMGNLIKYIFFRILDSRNTPMILEWWQISVLKMYDKLVVLFPFLSFIKGERNLENRVSTSFWSPLIGHLQHKNDPWYHQHIKIIWKDNGSFLEDYGYVCYYLDACPRQS